MKHDFAWENNEYEIPEETLVHPEISAEFPGILMDGDDKERDLGLDDQDETDEEVIRRVLQTTGVPAHGAGVAGVRDVVGTDNGPTVIILQQNSGDEGVDNDKDDDDNNPEDSGNDDSDSVDTTPENPLLEDNTVADEREQDGVLTEDDETQWGNDQAEGTTFNAARLRRSTRIHRAPSSYIPSTQGNKYQYQETVNLNVPEDTKYRKFTETDQLLHVLGVDMIQAHGLHKGIKLHIRPGGKERGTKRDAAAPRYGNLRNRRPLEANVR